MFGKFLRKLIFYGIPSVDGHWSEVTRTEATRLWKALHENCTQLLELEIRDCDLNIFKPINSPEMSRELEGLHLFVCRGTDRRFIQIFNHFANVKRFSVIFCKSLTFHPDFVDENVPQEVWLELKWSSYDVCPPKYFVEFIRKNPQIEKLHCDFLQCEHLELIAENCKNIESITLACYGGPSHMSRSTIGLNRFAMLKELFLACITESVAALIEKLVETNLLESLSLQDATMDKNLCVALAKLSNLKSLQLLRSRCLDSNLTLTDFLFDQSEIEFEWIETAVKCSHSIETLSVNSHKKNLVTDRNFTRLVDARKESRAKVPLKIILLAAATIPLPVSDQLIEANARYIKLEFTHRRPSYIAYHKCEMGSIFDFSDDSFDDSEPESTTDSNQNEK